MAKDFTGEIKLIPHGLSDLKKINGKLIFEDDIRTTARSVVIEFSEKINYRALLQLLINHKVELLKTGYLGVKITGSNDLIFFEEDTEGGEASTKEEGR